MEQQGTTATLTRPASMETSLVPTKASAQNILDVLKPFEADDAHKGTFLVLRIAGLDKGMALRVINRKYRSWQNWRATDEYFRELDDATPELAHRFGGEARVLRTALLDAHIIETGVAVFRKILKKEPVTDGMWAYAVKMAGLRVPMMSQITDGGNPWERLANAIKSTITQRELVVAQEVDGTRSVTAKEVVVQPSLEQRQMASDIVQRMLQQAREVN